MLKEHRWAFLHFVFLSDCRKVRWKPRERGWMYRVSRGHTVGQRFFLSRNTGRAERRGSISGGEGGHH